MNELERKINDAISKAMNDSLAQIGTIIGDQIGPVLKKQNEKINNANEDINICINSLTQVNFLLFGMLCKTSPDFLRILENFLGKPPPCQQEKDHHYHAFLKILSDMTLSMNQVAENPASPPPWFRGVLLGKGPKPPVNSDEEDDPQT